MDIILFFICLFACIIGAISGIGGGIIIKPIIDTLGIMNMSSLSFLSGCTVFAMSIVSLFKIKGKNLKINIYIPIFLGIGASIGGIIGKQLFDIIVRNFHNNKVGLVQSILLFVVNTFILIFMFIKHKLKTRNIQSKIITILLGSLLGIVSSFLGIGGGPLNIAIIYYFYSLQPKETAYSSLIVVFFSQLFSLLFTIYVRLPEYKHSYFIFMCFGGIFGALIGSSIYKKLDDDKTQKFFIIILIGLIFLNIFNIIKFI